MSSTEISDKDSDSRSQQNGIEEEDDEPSPEFQEYCLNLLGTRKNEKCSKGSYSIIPKFYQRLPKDPDSLEQKLREEARAQFLQKRSKELLDNNELKALWELLDKHHSPPVINGEKFINYDNYLNVIKESNNKIRIYLTATTFAKFLVNSGQAGKVSIVSLLNYTMRKVCLQQTRIGLSLYDYTGQGYLTEPNMESYILELIPTLAQLEGLEKTFHSFYVCTVVRKFFFFLDPMRTGRIKIRDILACNFLDDLLELRDDGILKDSQDGNWFAAQPALSVYGHYLNLDKDRNGMLSKIELAGYGSGTLTSVFLDRVFEECLTYDGEMDYKSYLDFVLALENRHEMQSIQYLFKILDVDHQGYLTAFNLNFFFKGIQAQIIAHRAEDVNFEDVKDEIFDMVRPTIPNIITFKDLIRCGQGETVISILIEFDRFHAYENREAIVLDPNPDDIHNSPK